MKIRYTRRAKRILGPCTWSKENGWVTEVPREWVVEALTNPDFMVDFLDPMRLRLGVSADLAAELALAGIINLEDIQALDEGGLMRLKRSLGEHNHALYAWAQIARDALAQDAQTPSGETLTEEE